MQNTTAIGSVKPESRCQKYELHNQLPQLHRVNSILVTVLGLTAETIIKIVSDFYSPKEIVEAKTVFHNDYKW